MYLNTTEVMNVTSPPAHASASVDTMDRFLIGILAEIMQKIPRGNQNIMVLIFIVILLTTILLLQLGRTYLSRRRQNASQRDAVELQVPT